MKILHTFFLLFLFFFAISSEASVAPSVVRVGVVGEPPFMTVQNGNVDGLSVGVWKKVADEAHITYQLIPMGTDVDAALAAMNQGKFQMLIGGIAVISSRLSFTHFSRPFFINNLFLVELGKHKSFLAVIKAVISPFFKAACLVSILLLFIFSVLHWILDHRYHQRPLSVGAFFEALWIVVIAMFGFGDYPIRHQAVLARLLTLVALIFAGVFSMIFASAAMTSMTIASSDLSLNQKSFRLHARFDRPIAVVRGTYAEYVLQAAKAKVVPVLNFDQGIALLRERKVDGLVDNEVTVKYYWHSSHEGLMYAKLPIGTNEMAFAFPKESLLRGIVDQVLTHLQDQNEVFGICVRYIGQESSENCMI